MILRKTEEILHSMLISRELKKIRKELRLIRRMLKPEYIDKQLGEKYQKINR